MTKFRLAGCAVIGLVMCGALLWAATPLDLATSLRACVYSLRLKNTGANQSTLAQCQSLSDQLVAALAPVPPPPPPPAALTITCPSNQAAVSLDGLPVSVSYPVATTTGGLAPVTVTGNPVSGSLFAVGSTTVTQSAQSADGQSDTCTHSVSVTYTPPPPPPGGGLAISGVTGSFTRGSAVTITGSGFGTKAAAAPLVFDTFENGTLGAFVSNGQWNDATQAGNGINPIYGNAVLRPNSTRTAVCTFPSGSTSSNFWKTFASPQPSTLLLDFWFRADWGGFTSPSDFTHFKFWRLHNYTANTAPDTLWHLAVGSSPGWFAATSETAALPVSDLNARGGQFYLSEVDNTWGHLRFLLIMSGAGQSNGTFKAWFNNRLVLNDTSWNFRNSGDPATWDHIFFGNFGNHTRAFHTYWDDVYVDGSQARVELGDAPVYANATHTEIQPASAWADGAITLTANRGSFNAGQTAYLYVVTAAGSASPGFAVTLP